MRQIEETGGMGQTQGLFYSGKPLEQPEGFVIPYTERSEALYRYLADLWKHDGMEDKPEVSQENIKNPM